MSDDAPELPASPAESLAWLPVEELYPSARNARTHSDEQVEQIAESMRRWGWTIPVLIDEAGELIAGHGRLLAAQRLGLSQVPAMVAEGWSEEQKRAYRIADNRLAENAGWDTELLTVELRELDELEFDVGLLGFSGEEISELLGTAGSTGMPDLGSGDPAITQMTFTFAPHQAAVVKSALRAAKEAGEFADTGNSNANGNALHRICAAYIEGTGYEIREGDHDE